MAAAMRERIADERDRAADERERIAGAREPVTHNRGAPLTTDEVDRWHREAVVRAAAAQARDEAAEARDRAARRRDMAGAPPDHRADARDYAANRREREANRREREADKRDREVFAQVGGYGSLRSWLRCCWRGPSFATSVLRRASARRTRENSLPKPATLIPGWRAWTVLGRRWTEG
jgi:uncharacterized protein (DUF3084 family)